MELNDRALLDALDDAIVCTTTQGQVLFLNQSAAAVFGCSPDPQETPELLRDFLKELSLPELQSHLQTKVSRRLMLNKSGGQSVPCEVSISVAAKAGEPLYCLKIRDISLEQQMERAVVQARKNQALGALAGGIAHDFNNILTGIISNLDLAVCSSDCGDELRPVLQHAAASARSGAELVKKLQMFSREFKTKFAPVDLIPIVDQAIFLLRRSMDRSIQFEFLAPNTKVWTVNGDPVQLGQALLNVAIGLRDTMPDGGRIRIWLENVNAALCNQSPSRQACDCVRLTIQQVCSTVSRSAQRLSSRYPVSERNSILGLAATGTILTDHGGWVETEPVPGIGTNYLLYIPRMKELPPVNPSHRVAAHEAKRAKGGKEHLLVVDDEELVRMVIRAVLSYHGYQITEAIDGEDGFRKYAADPQHYDLILMDLLMPRLDGISALLQIRQQYPEAKAILLSGHLPEEHSDCSQLKDLRLLPKPFDNQELLQLVREVLDGKPS